MGALDAGMREEELQPLVDAWRAANPQIVRFWWDVDRAAKKAVKEKIRTETHGIRFVCQSGMLFIRLLSGRSLCYVKPRMGENKFGGESVTYADYVIYRATPVDVDIGGFPQAGQHELEIFQAAERLNLFRRKITQGVMRYLDFMFGSKEGFRCYDSIRIVQYYLDRLCIHCVFYVAEIFIMMNCYAKDIFHLFSPLLSKCLFYFIIIMGNVFFVLLYFCLHRFGYSAILKK